MTSCRRSLTSQTNWHGGLFLTCRALHHKQELATFWFAINSLTVSKKRQMRYKYFNIFVVAFFVNFFTIVLYEHAHLTAKSGLGLVGPEDHHDDKGGP